MLERFSEDRKIRMLVHDNGTVITKWLQPGEEVIVPMHWNDFDNYYSYHTQIASHHSFGVPLFAGEYQVRAFFNPEGNAIGDSLYQYDDGFKNFDPSTKKLTLNAGGETTQPFLLKIRKTHEQSIRIEGKKYLTCAQDGRYLYYIDSIGNGGSNPRLVHITNLPVDSSGFVKKNDEYFYSHFDNVFAEYMTRFPDGDIKEYRKYRDVCPDEILTYRFNDSKTKTYYAVKLEDGRFYSIAWHDDGRTHSENYYSADGTLAIRTDYVYNKKKELLRKKEFQFKPCIDSLLEDH